jgi:hypothetical protein
MGGKIRLLFDSQFLSLPLRLSFEDGFPPLRMVLKRASM